MDFPTKRALPQGSVSPRSSPRATRHGPRGMEADENVSPRRSVPATAASPQGKKVLGERNIGGGWWEVASPPRAPQQKPAPSPPSLTGRGAGPYDPKTNYTTPRPDFLRYDPERSREILLRLGREVEAESSNGTSGTVVSEAVSSGSSARGSDSETECDEIGEEEEVEGEEEAPAHRGGWARRLFILLAAVACSFCYMRCMISTHFPASPEEHLHFVGLNESMYDYGVDQVDYFQWPIGMMESDDLLQANGQIELGETENAVHMYEKGGSPRNFMAIAMMGMADICLDVPLGEFTCQIGDESHHDMDDQQEGYELGEQITDVEEKSVVTYQEEGEGYPLLDSLEKLDDGEGLEIEMLDQEADPWEYENTAEAAKAIGAMVKFLWNVMEPHLLQMLACLSAAGFMASLFKHFQRPHKVPAPVSKQMPSAPPAQVPVLAPHQVAPLPVFASPQSVQLSVFASEQSVQPVAPEPVHFPLPKLDPFVGHKVPVVDHGNHDQKMQHGDVSMMKASDRNYMDHKEIDSLKLPVVELLGEFSFVDEGSSRGRSNKHSNQHEGHVIVQESSPLGNVVKTKKDSSKTESPSVPRVRKEDNDATIEQMGATPTPLRRSSRLRNRVTSP